MSHGHGVRISFSSVDNFPHNLQRRVTDIISPKRQIRIHMRICNVLFVKINDNFKKQFKTAADHSEITHIKTFLVEKPPQLPK